jgi:hypothetical protein
MAVVSFRSIWFEVPIMHRTQGYYRFKSIPYYNRMLLNDNYTKHISPRGEAQRKKEYDRIEMHDGNFKPYASEAYYRIQNPNTSRNDGILIVMKP